MSAPLPTQPTRNHHRRNYLALTVLALVAAGGIALRMHSRSVLAEETGAYAVPTVVVIQPGTTTVTDELVLPGSIEAISSASIYARTAGYLKAWHTDIGTRVKKGQLLAEIDVPELDQQLAQAQADLATAQANYRQAQATNERWKNLLVTESVPKQDAEEKASDATAKKSIAESAAANVARLRELESFKRVTAPFDGTVVARNTDIGNLINAGQASGGELFRVADTRRLRVNVQVPQSFVSSARPGMGAELGVEEHPGQRYPAKVTRTANAIDPTSRSLQVQLELDNAKGELLPGAYTEVHFKAPASAEILRVPPTTLLFRAGGLQVATVGADNRVSLKKITQGRDFGTSIEVLSGIDKDDRIIINPPDSITDGATVRIVEPAKPATKDSSGEHGTNPPGKSS